MHVLKSASAADPTEPIVIAIAEDIKHTWTYENFRALVRFKIDAWISANRGGEQRFCGSLQPTFYEDICSALVARFNIDTRKLSPEFAFIMNQ